MYWHIILQVHCIKQIHIIKNYWNNGRVNIFKLDYPEEPTDIAKVNSEEYGGMLLGENNLGTVHIHGPYGNIKSNVKIAYNIGMHPLESKSHRALFEVLNSKNDELNYQYFIYNINVTGELDEKTEGRMDGQLLAQEFVAPHIIGGDYDFFVDVHSNKGQLGPGKYEETYFIFAPGFDEKSSEYMNILLNNINQICYYAPEYRTSPEYITIPVVNNGIPTIVYETFSYEAMTKTYELASLLVENVDKLKFD